MKKRYFGKLLSIALSATLAFTSVVPAHAADFSSVDDKEIVVDQSEFDATDEEEPVVGTTVEEAGAEAGEEIAEEPIFSDDSESTTAVLKIRYFDAEGNEIGATFADPDAGVEKKTLTKASAQNISLKSLSTYAKSYYDVKWVAKGSISPFTLNDDGAGIKADANAVTGDMEISFQLAYTAYEYTINYYSSEYVDATTSKHTKNPGDLANSTYKKAYTYSESEPYILVPAAPELSGKNQVDWETATVASDGTVTPSGSAILEFADDADYIAVTPVANKNSLVINLYAKYAANAATGAAYPDKAAAKNNWKWPVSGGSEVEPEWDGTNKEITLTKPTRAGYTFAGWYTDEALTKQVNQDANSNPATYTFTAGTNDNGTISFYTKWTANTYNIVLKNGVAEGSKYDATLPTGTPTTITYNDHATQTIEIGEPTRDNYSFSAWKIKNVAQSHNGTTHITTYSVNLDDLSGDDSDTFEFTAYWGDSTKTHTVTLKDDYGSGSAVYSGATGTEAASSYTISDAASATITPAKLYLIAPTNANLTFAGWYTTADFSGEALSLVDPSKEYASSDNRYVYTIQDTDISGLTFYAKWSEKDDVTYAHVTYSLDGGTNNANNKALYVISGETTITLSDPTKSGYVFKGWYTESTFINKLEDGKYIIANFDSASEEAAQLTFYAKWEKAAITQSVTYDSVAGTIVGTFVVDEDGMQGATAVVATDITTATTGWNALLANKFDEDGKIKKDTLPELTKPGYIFLGYYTTNDEDEQDETTKVVEGETVFDGVTKTLYAAWKPITYKVTFVSESPAATKEKEYKQGDAAPITSPFAYSDIPTATQTNATTGILSYDSSVSGMGSVAKGATSDGIITAYEDVTNKKVALTRSNEEVAITLTAVWGSATEKKFYVKYNANCEYTGDDDDYAGSAFTVSGAASLTKLVEAVAGKDITITGAEYVRKGYTLSGWMYGTTLLKAGDTLKIDNIVAGSVVELKAQWTEDKPYGLKVNLNGKGAKYTSKIKTPSTYTYSEGYTLPIKADLTRLGYEFTGWNTKADGTGTPVTKIGKDGQIETGDVVLYAQWWATGYTITFDTNGGRELAPVTLEYEESISLKDHQAVRPGYKFKNWSAVVDGKAKSISGTANIKSLTKTVGANITFTANWTPIKFSITYDLGTNGKMDKPVKSYTPDKAGDIVINKPTRAGYTFVGWGVTRKDTKSTWPSIAGTTYNATYGYNVLTTEILDDKKVGTGTYSFTAEDYGNVKLVALWTETVYKFEFYEGSAVRATLTGLAYSDKIDFTDVANGFDLKDEANKGMTVKGFGFGDGKVKYALNKTYKIEEVIKAVGIENDASAAKDPVKLYAVTEDAKFFVTTKVSGVTTTYVPDKTINYAPKSGTTIKVATYAGYTLDKITVTGGKAGTDYEIAKDNKSVKILKGTKTDKMVVTIAYKANTYTVYIMPQADDAKYGGKAVTKKDGYKYLEKVPYNTTDKDLSAAFTNLTRAGYDLEGFSTTTNAKGIFAYLNSAGVMVGGDLDMLKADKNGIAKVYAIWSANGIAINYDTYADVTNAEKEPKNISSYIPAKSKSYVVGKGLSLPKLSVPGYKFVGWKLVDKNDGVAVAKNGYATKITNKSTGAVHVKAVLTENTYKLSVNPNGGTINGSKKTAVVEKSVRYSQDIQEYITKIASSAQKSGYMVTDFTLVAKPKDDTVHYGVGAEVRLNSTKAVTLYPQWASTSASKGVGFSAVYDGTNVTVKAVGLTNNDTTDRYEIQVSKDKTFASAVKVVKAVQLSDLTGATGKAVVPMTGSNVFYARVRRISKDANNDDVAGEWFATVTASRNADSAATATITITYELPKADGTYGTAVTPTATVKVVPGESTSGLIVPPIVGYKTDGVLYKDAKCEEEDEGTRVTGNLNRYVKAEEVNEFTLNFDMNDSTMDSITSMSSVKFTKNETKYTKDAYPGPSVDEAYGFDGWYRDPALTSAVAENAAISTVAGDVTFYAKWTPYTYNVKFDKNNDKASGSQSAETATFGRKYWLPANTFTAPDGYVFDRWELPDGSLVAAYDPVEGLAADKKGGDITVKATWKKKTTAALTVIKTKQVTESTYSQFGGTSYSGLASGTYITDVVDTISAPEGYILTRVYYSYKDSKGKDAIGVIYSEDWSEVTNAWAVVGSVATVYAAYRPITYSVAFNVNTGSGTAPTTITDVSYALENNKKVAPDAELTKAGYTFNGWNTLASPTTENPGTHYAVGAALTGLEVTDMNADDQTATLYAEWKTNTFTVEYYPNYPNGSKVTKTVNYSDGKAEDPEDLEFEYANHTFNKWTAVIVGGSVVSNVDKDDVLNAKLGTAIQTEGRVVKMYANWTEVRADLTVACAEGTAIGKTIATVTGATADGTNTKLAYKINDAATASGDIPALNANMTIDGSSGNYTVFASGDEIAITADKYLTVIYVAKDGANWKLKGFGEHKVVESEIKAAAAANSYTLTVTKTNVTSSAASGTITDASNYSATFTASAGYDLPDDVTITISGSSKTKDTDYTWSAGTLTIAKAKITGDVTIAVAGVAKELTITYNQAYGLDGGTFTGSVPTGDAAKVTVGQRFTSASIPAAGITVVKEGATTFHLTGWSLTEGGEAVTTSTDVPAQNSITLYPIWAAGDYE